MTALLALLRRALESRADRFEAKARFSPYLAMLPGWLK
jgi:hypothetical protein